MAITTLVLGESGTGKSASLRNFKKDEIALVNVASKPLPFRGKFEDTLNSDDYEKIKSFIRKTEKNVIVVDDAQYLMANEFMRRGLERGFDKFTEIAVKFWDLVNYCSTRSDEKIVIFLTHLERDASGNEKIKTIGKMLDEKITLEGMFTIVLKTNVSDGRFSFLTVNSGHDTVKSPIGLFETREIDNDLKMVCEKIKKYYEIDENVPFTFEEIEKTQEKEEILEEEEAQEPEPEPEPEQEQPRRRVRKVRE